MNCNGTTKRGWNVGSFGQPGCAVAVLLLFAAAAVGAEPAYVTDRQGQRPEPIVAIDNVCAWPNLTVLRDGTIIAREWRQQGWPIDRTGQDRTGQDRTGQDRQDRKGRHSMKKRSRGKNILFDSRWER